MRIPRITRRGACALGLAFWLTAGATYLAQQSGGAMLLSDNPLPAIDRGLRISDAPRPPRSDPDADGDAVPGSIIVKFRPGTTTAARQVLLSRVDGSAPAAPSYADFEIITIDPGADPEAVAARLDAEPDVAYAQARFRAFPRFVPNDPFYRLQWHYPAIDMERAWDINPGATPAVTVAVLDTGIAYRSAIVRYTARPFFLDDFFFPSLGTIDVPFAAAPELASPDRFVSPRDFIWDTQLPLDLDGHGTHVAGTIGQLTNNSVGVAGMAFNVRLMPVKVIAGTWDQVFSSPFRGTDDVVARGIRYAVDNGAKVLNLSIGRLGPPAPVVREAMAYAVARGSFVVVAAGNGFDEDNATERYAEFAPQLDGMVAVAAVGRDRRRAFYSTTGPYVELSAPGGDAESGGTAGQILQQTLDFDLVETYRRGPVQFEPPRFDSFAYDYLQGTSMAAPQVAGFAAMLIQQGVTSPAAIEAIMRRYATDLGPPGRDDEYGHGLINPRASLRGLGLAR